MLVYYGIPAGIVFCVVLSAYLRDTATPKNRPFDWFFIVVVTLLWPVTAPSMVWKKVTTLLKARSQRQKSSASIHPRSALEMPSHR